ncbi:MAG: PfkB family carbohydrate kinase, partial [Candidatus Thorarchaeota archaeon]
MHEQSSLQAHRHLDTYGRFNSQTTLTHLVEQINGRDSMGYDVVTFGEVMLRLSPPDFMRFEQTHSFNAHAGGAEMNVAVACARLELSSAYVTKLGDNSIGHFIRNKAREHGVDTSHILWNANSRCGVYFVEFGAAPRTNRVIYDRK